MDKFCYKIALAYDGSNYCGWQVQPNGLSIQEALQKALFTILKEKVIVIGSGRTDAGVHAYEQVAHFRSENSYNTQKLLYSLNGLLPHDIRILSVETAPKNFHARFSAKAKIYRYYIDLHHVHLPFKKPYSFHIRKDLDVSLIKEGAKHLIGTHNFSAFANRQDQGSAKSSPVKTLYRVDLIKESVTTYYFELHGNGFLYKMVRNIVGTLLDCGLKKITPSQVKDVLVSKDRKRASRAVPAHGLFLTKVFYNSF